MKRNYAAALPLALLLVLLAVSLAAVLRDDSAAEWVEGGPVVAREVIAPPHMIGEARDGPMIVNVWATWCVPCELEHPLLFGLSEETGLPLVGVAYRDRADKVTAHLAEAGDPYTAHWVDESRKAGVQLGIQGVPETFVLNEEGRIVWRRRAPLDAPARARLIEAARLVASGQDAPPPAP